MHEGAPGMMFSLAHPLLAPDVVLLRVQALFMAPKRCLIPALWECEVCGGSGRDVSLQEVTHNHHHLKQHQEPCSEAEWLVLGRMVLKDAQHRSVILPSHQSHRSHEHFSTKQEYILQWSSEWVL